MKLILASCLLFFSINVTAQTMVDLGTEAAELYQKGQYEKAIPVAEKAVIAFRKELGEDNEFYIRILSLLASSYRFAYQYQKSETLFLEIKERIKKLSGETAESYTTCLNNLAGLYENMGQYEKAEPIFLNLIAIRKRMGGDTDPAYMTGLNNLAYLYHTMGHYAKAEPLYTQVRETRKKTIGQEHKDYAISLNNLATLYAETGQYEKAEPLYIQANEIQKKLLGENDPEYALGLNNLANLWQNMQQFSKAESAYIQSMEIRKKALGINHPDYAASLNNLATLYAAMNNYKKAKPLIIESKDIWKRALGENSLAYATGLNNLAGFYRKTQTQYAQAEILYLEALRLRKMILGINHPYYSETQNDLALLYIQMRQYKKAEPLLFSSSNILLQNIIRTFSILSEKEKANYLDYNREIIDCNNSFLYINPKASPAIIENNYNLELGYKSLSLADTRNMLELVRNSKDTTLRKIFGQWMTAKNLLASQYALPSANRMSNLKMMEEEAELLEKELNRRSAEFSNQQKALRITVQDIQKNLDDDEAAIEFVKFRLYNKKRTDSVMYAAYILRKNEPVPKFIALCEQKQLEQLLVIAGTSATRMVKSLYHPTDPHAIKVGVKLYKLVWAPLEPYLKGIKKISYSPAGSLYGIAFHALPVDAKIILMDKYRLQQYTSTRQISLRTQVSETSKPDNIVLFGDALFSMDSLDLVKQRNNKIDGEAGLATAYLSTRGNGMGLWINLPGTAEEIITIGRLFEENKISTRSFIQANASEDNLKTFTGKSPQILHIATHGFFLPEIQKKEINPGALQGNVYSLANDPLLRSGLVLAGGNYVWSGKAPVDGVEDGIVTAYEISQLNLSNTELLVLSACETALGDVKGTEGVFGLQRGFKMAGTKKMIVSLWQVPDKETAELMTLFYNYWMKGRSISESFYQAQVDMRKKYAAYYWAAFVLVE